MSTSATDASLPSAPTAAALVGALADETRRRVFAAVQLGATTTEAIASAAGVNVGEAGKALGKLVEVGVVVQRDGALRVPAAVFQSAARAALARPARTEHADQPAEARRVLDVFVVDGRLTQIPTAHSKRQVVLDWLAQLFEPGRTYREPMVNLILGQRHADTAALRRYLVDDGYLSREAGVYWRSGGTVDGPSPGVVPANPEVVPAAAPASLSPRLGD